MSIIKRKFQYTDLAGNSNKFWQFEYDQNAQQATFTWGRVGDAGQSKTMGMGAYQLEKKIAEKEAKGYQEVILGNVSVTAQPAQAHPFAQWIGLAAQTSIQSFYNGDLNTLSVEQVRKGREALKKVWFEHSMGVNPIYAVNEYYRIIPTQLPRRIDPDELCRSIIRDFALQEDRLNQLEASLAQVQVVPGTTVLPFEIRDVAQSEPLFGEIHDWVHATDTHGIRPKIKAIYELELPAERKRYEAETFGDHNIVTLFHGTNTSVMQHIALQGLKVPHYAANGSLLGRGIYMADKSSKSMNYCNTSGNVPNMLLICEAKIGDAYVADDECPSFHSAPAGYHHVMGKAGHTRIWGNSTLKFNEYVTYRPSQVTIRSVVCFDK